MFRFKAFPASTFTPRIIHQLTSRLSTMDLQLVVNRLKEFADPKLAANWDNVGLLVEPTAPHHVTKVLFTNDLTEPVLEEAITKKVNMIVAYHPPIFSGLKRLTQSEWKERVILRCIENRIAVYSPHTSWDAMFGGNADWILAPFKCSKIEPVQSSASLVHPAAGLSKSFRVHFHTVEAKDQVAQHRDVSSSECIRFLSESNVGDSFVETEFLCNEKGAATLFEIIKQNFDIAVLSSVRITQLDKPLYTSIGMGRIGYLAEPMKLRDVVVKTKTHLKMKTLRVAIANDHSLDDEVRSIAVCAGSGSKLLNNLPVDLIISGEFPHHEILHEVHRGTSLILTDHTNNERGFGEVFKQRFTELLAQHHEQVDIEISQVDRDPLECI